METMTTPSWLITTEQELSQLASTDKYSANLNKLINKEREYNYEIVFERVLAIIEQTGRPLTDIINEIMARESQVELSHFRKWINKSAERRDRFNEARRLGAEAIEDQLISIADADYDSEEDVQRSRLKIDTRKWLLAVWDKKKYSDRPNSSSASSGVVNVYIEGVVSPYCKEEPSGITIEHNPAGE